MPERKLPDGVTPITYTPNYELPNTSLWNVIPKEFGAPYKLNFVGDNEESGEDIRHTVRYGVGVFLPDNGGGWHIWGPSALYKPLRFITYDTQPLYYIGYRFQSFQHLLNSRVAKVILPEIYKCGYSTNLNITLNAAMFGTFKALKSKNMKFEDKAKAENQILIKHLKPMCPMCKNGVLLTKEHPETKHLQSDGYCINCGQAVHFINL